MLTSRSRIVVRYNETDMMGVVYHGSYLPWFEVGRTTLLRESGLPYRELENDGYFLPVIEVGAKYLRPARYDDQLDIVTTLAERPLLRIRLDYEVKRGDELLVTGFTVHSFINKSGQPVRPPAAFAAKMREIFPAGG
ncbi:MAG TPA: thioesterase family protein [Candidatus Didemnitutus sp.]|nr:thioesterase family protein [Candidatus Didemnitutus sp.]